ncbi:adenylate/guanylate cyclase domain-containing protein [Nocardioides humilatus]|uniref:adenylate/guanylate cyclase domain-containing protein n=1 Tax=Nocardioides humilatus TaxID=2607660 RepID=UPI00165EEA4C|nr:adenylate/guanylate cyclase domain-containing protein [Nocardioides humilatus]
MVDLLAEYYDAVGEAVARHGGTITCYAGDGVLMLVGAPLPRPDHAAAALALAQDLIDSINPVLERWATKVHPLGLGVGVASGTVTVGTIGSTNRLDYTAVGTPVNLAARLCSAARAGEVLMDERTAQLAANSRVKRREAMPVKGLIGLQTVFELGAV